MRSKQTSVVTFMVAATIAVTSYLLYCVYLKNITTTENTDAALPRQSCDSPVRSIAQYVNAPIPEDDTDRVRCMNYSKVSVGKRQLTYPMCLYVRGQDQIISRFLRTGKGWDVKNVETILEHLGEPRSDMGFIDLGANLGSYALAAAAAGHQVVAVEPMDSTLRKFKKAIDLGSVKDKITTVQAGISNVTGKLYLLAHRTNKGGSQLKPRSLCKTDATFTCNPDRPIPIILMNHLLEVITFKNAVMKMDIEGHDCRSLPKAEKFLDTINIKFIRMEFGPYMRNWKTPAQVKEVEDMISFMKGKGYTPRTDDLDSLEGIKWRRWSRDIVWTK